MAREDFDVDSLAKYLHLTPAQVLRLASREKLPGRKISGQWRFSQAEIHHWLEERIGLSGQEELIQVEEVLDRHGGATEAPPVSIVSLITPEAIACPLDARSRGSVISSICEHVANAGLLWDASRMAEAIRIREKLHPTALDNGVALLHPRRPQTSIIGDPFLGLGITPQGIPFGGPRGQLTDIFFLIGSTDDRGHLRVLARLSRLVAQPEFLNQLRDAEDAHQAHQVMQTFDEQIRG